MATMRDALLQNGFADQGACKFCGGGGWLYGKTANGAYIEVKVAIRNNDPNKERGHAKLFIRNRLKANILSPQYLIPTLEFNGVIEKAIS